MPRYLALGKWAQSFILGFNSIYSDKAFIVFFVILLGPIADYLSYSAIAFIPVSSQKAFSSL